MSEPDYSVKTELERKVLTELERLVRAANEREMSKGTFGASMQTLWQVTAGLIEKETADLISDAINELSAPGGNDSRFLKSGSLLLTHPSEPKIVRVKLTKTGQLLADALRFENGGWVLDRRVLQHGTEEGALKTGPTKLSALMRGLIGKGYVLK